LGEKSRIEESEKEVERKGKRGKGERWRGRIPTRWLANSYFLSFEGVARMSEGERKRERKKEALVEEVFSSSSLRKGDKTEKVRERGEGEMGGEKEEKRGERWKGGCGLRISLGSILFLINY